LGRDINTYGAMSGRQILEDNSIVNVADLVYRQGLFDTTNIAIKYTTYSALSTSMVLYGFYTASDTTDAVLKDNAETVTIMTGANTLTLISTSTADTTLGTGARSLSIVGLDVNGDQISEIVNLNGTVSAVSTLQFSRINRVIVIVAGGGTAPVGTIYIGQGAIALGKPTIINGVIMPGVGWMRQAIISTPRNYFPILSEVTTGAGNGKEVLFNLKTRLSGSGWIDTFTWNTYQQLFQQSFKVPPPYYDKCDIQLTAKASQAGTTCMGLITFQLIHISLL